MFDGVNADFSDFVLNEVLPAVQKLKTKDGRALNISTSGNDHMATGASSGGIGAFSLAWQRPDQFSRVYSVIGTFVSMRGGNEYPALIRKTDPKPIRIFLEDGSTDAWNPLFGFWYEQNLSMESALTFAGYDVAHAWGTHGHDGTPGSVVFPDVMRWLWRDYPSVIKAGTSHNDSLGEITLPNEGWQKIPQTFQSAAGLAADAKGDVYLSDAPAGTVYRLGADDKPAAYLEHGPGIVAHSLVVNHDGMMYVSEPGEHAELPSHIWQIKPSGEKKIVDEGLFPASGVALQPDGVLFYAGESSNRWVYSYVVQPDGTLTARQPFYWLHTADLISNSGVEDLALDSHGSLYAATRIGIQVGDLRGGVRSILPLPTPCGPVRSLCFGGPQFDTLYVTDGTQVFKRHMKVVGFAPWAPPIAMPVPGGP